MGSFAGIVQEQNTGRRPFTAPSGFRAIVQEYPIAIRFIKVTDFKGVPLDNVTVTVNNTGGSLVTYTNSDGIAEIEPDMGEIVTIDLNQYSMELVGVSYDTDNEETTKTIILDTLIPML